MASPPEIPPFYVHSRHIYAFRHALNTVDVFLPKDAVPSESLWIVYIHGGAWRDPMVDSLSVVPALHHLNPAEHGISGIASINYGLSPYPKHPVKPSSPGDPSRNNVHPNHVEDIVSAMSWLHKKYLYEEKYILAGHSCGATLAFQTLSRSSKNACKLITEAPRAPYPSALVGVHGIYDLNLLIKDNVDVPMYREFVESTFGNIEFRWQFASPVGWPYHKLWSYSRAVVLAHSDEDELLNWNQTRAMEAHLATCKFEGRRDVVLKTKGKHDEIWEEGSELARVLQEALKMVRQSGW